MVSDISIEIAHKYINNIQYYIEHEQLSSALGDLETLRKYLTEPDDTSN